MDIAKGLKVLNTTVIVAVAISSLAGAYVVYKDFFRPKVQIESVNYNEGLAYLLINGKPRTLYSDAIISAGGDWGIRFGKDAAGRLTRIELVKRNLVYEVYL